MNKLLIEMDSTILIGFLTVIFFYLFISLVIWSLSRIFNFNKKDFKSAALSTLLAFLLPFIAIVNFIPALKVPVIILSSIAFFYLFYKKSLTELIPVGLLFIIALSIGNIIRFFNYIVINPLIDVGFTILIGSTAFLVLFFLIIIEAAIIFGILYKKIWSWWLIIINYSCGFLVLILREIRLPIYKFFFGNYYKFENFVYGTLHSYNLYQIIFIGFILLIIIIYTISKKSYFSCINGKKKTIKGQFNTKRSKKTRKKKEKQ